MKRIHWILSTFLILGIFVGTGLWYLSPWKAIQDLEQAIEKKDLALLYKRIDLDGLRSSVIDALKARDLMAKREPSDLVDRITAEVSAGLQKVPLTQSMDLIKHEIETELLRDRRVPEALPESASQHPLRYFFHDLESIEWGEWFFVDEGVLVNSTWKLRKMRKSYPLTMKMVRSEGGTYRMSGFEGLSTVLMAYETDRAARLVTYNDQIKRRLEAEVPFFGEIRMDASAQALKSIVHLDVLFQNKSKETVTRIVGEILDDPLAPKIRASFDSQVLALEPTSKKVFLLEKSQFLSPNNPALNGQALKFLYSRVEFANGQVVTPAKDFESIPEL